MGKEGKGKEEAEGGETVGKVDRPTKDSTSDICLGAPSSQLRRCLPGVRIS